MLPTRATGTSSYPSSTPCLALFGLGSWFSTSLSSRSILRFDDIETFLDGVGVVSSGTNNESSLAGDCDGRDNAVGLGVAVGLGAKKLEMDACFLI
jgi:hypothetical protein